MTERGGKHVAIVGSGAAGLAALWALHNCSDCNVYLYEADNRLGGHSNTVMFERKGKKVPVDTGFIVCNSATYPNFLAFLKAIHVPTVTSEMTFSVSRNYGAFEWAGTSLGTIFAQLGNLFSPRMWRMLFDIIRFNHYALDVLRCGRRGPSNRLTISKYLENRGYSNGFREDYLIPMIAAIWSTSPDKCDLEFPLVTLITFMWNHHLLDTISSRPEWLTLRHGSRSYIDAVMANFPEDRVFLNTPIRSISNDPSESPSENGSSRISLTTEEGEVKAYDHVILATHGPQAYSIISSSATPEERKILSEFHTSPNRVVLHSDKTLMPRNVKTWSSWNYLTRGNARQVSLTYYMNKLQHIPLSTFGPVLATLNPLHEPSPETVQGTYSYDHPLYTPEAVQAQKVLPTIQGTRGISYAGAWTRYGFHEDAFASGFAVAVDQFAVKLPFPLVRNSLRDVPELAARHLVLRLFLGGLQFIFRCIDWMYGYEPRRAKSQEAKKHL